MNTTERYFLKADYRTEWDEVSKEQFIQAEQAAGFHSKFGLYHLATAGFSGRGVSGRIETIIIDTLTCSSCGFTEPLTEQVTREVAEQDGWLLGEVVYCPKHGPDDERGEGR